MLLLRHRPLGEKKSALNSFLDVGKAKALGFWLPLASNLQERSLLKVLIPPLFSLILRLLTILE